MKIGRVFRVVRSWVQVRINKRNYFVKLGVKLGKNTTIYGHDYGMFSTEPWLVSIGDNCSITEGCKFLTHDGGTLVTKNIDSDLDDFVICGRIKVGNNTYIGIRTIILPGVVIGDNCIMDVDQLLHQTLLMIV